jgi:hypothetical protein
MRMRTGFFPYLLGAIWAALVVLALVEMANFSATVAPQRAAAKAGAAPAVQVRTVRRSM